MAQATRSLPRVLRLFDVSVLASASMGPAYSLASTMGPMIAATGANAPYALIVLSAVMVSIAFGFSALSRVSPNAGSSYAWIRESFGARVGAYGAWLLLLSNVFATLAIAVPAGDYTLALVAPQLASSALWTSLVGVIWIVVSGVLLYVGVRPTALVTFLGLALEMIVLIAAAVAAAFHPAPVFISPSRLPLSGGAIGFVTAMTLAVWMSDGWEVSASTSEEVDGAASVSGKGGIAGLIASTIVLVACMFAFMHVGTINGFVTNSADSLAYVGSMLGSSWWRPLIVVTVLLSTLTTLWTTVLYLSRSVYAMGRDGVLPRALGALDPRNEPLVALVAVTLFSIVFEVITGFSPTVNAQLQTVINASSVFLGLLFVLSALAAVRRFVPAGKEWLSGVILPAFGACMLGGVLVATIALEDRHLAYYAWGGLLIGLPFALWRGRA